LKKRTDSLLKWISVLLLWSAGVSCSPVSISRMGPAVTPRPSDCEIDVLAEGALPSRPYRDLGVVALKNCQDYKSGLCLRWLTEAACQLGGQVAYLPKEGGPVVDSQPVLTEQGGALVTSDSVTYRILIAAYVADLNYHLADDPVYKAMVCDPHCKEGETCSDGKCKPSEDCPASKEKKKVEPDHFDTVRCTD
jgi:hypothetical protein